MTDTAAQENRAQRRPRADGERTRGAIVRAAASLATMDGLEGLPVGNLAAAIGMSTSGRCAHFGSQAGTPAGRSYVYRERMTVLTKSAGLADPAYRSGTGPEGASHGG